MLTFQLVQNHGGWNSDDNQNNNLGRFRFSVTDAARRRGRPAAAAVSAQILAIPHEKRTPAQDGRRLQLLADDRAGMEGRQRRDRSAVEAAPGRLVAAGAAGARRSRATTHVLKRGDFLKPAQTR